MNVLMDRLVAIHGVITGTNTLRIEHEICFVVSLSDTGAIMDSFGSFAERTISELKACVIGLSLRRTAISFTDQITIAM